MTILINVAIDLKFDSRPRRCVDVVTEERGAFPNLIARIETCVYSKRSAMLIDAIGCEIGGKWRRREGNLYIAAGRRDCSTVIPRFKGGGGQDSLIDGPKNWPYEYFGGPK